MGHRIVELGGCRHILPLRQGFEGGGFEVGVFTCFLDEGEQFFTADTGESAQEFSAESRLLGPDGLEFGAQFWVGDGDQGLLHVGYPFCVLCFTQEGNQLGQVLGLGQGRQGAESGSGDAGICIAAEAEHLREGSGSVAGGEHIYQERFAGCVGLGQGAL